MMGVPAEQIAHDLASLEMRLGYRLFEEGTARLTSAARDAGVSLRQIEARQQAPDHPILWNVPETDYLKFYLFQVV